LKCYKNINYIYYIISNKKIWYAPNKKEAYGDLEIQAVMDVKTRGGNKALYNLAKIINEKNIKIYMPNCMIL
jgi:hypothetical protein